jgi:NADH-quinone oxidoreductase subunit C
MIEIVLKIDTAASVVPNSTPVTILIAPSKLVDVARELQTNPETYFDQLSCVTGIDAVNSMEVIYHLYSIPFNLSLALKVILPRDNPQVPTLSSVWKSANWMERETYDMYGIIFEQHPDLRRILMPADWEGYPLRKDYKEQDQYRDVQVKY